MASRLKQFRVPGSVFDSQLVTRNWKQAFCLFAFVLSTTGALAENLPDPTQPPTGTFLPEVIGGSGLQGGLILQSVLISPRHKSAIISGKSYEQGDKLGEATIVKITETEVVLQEREDKQTLSLFPSNIEKKPVVAKSSKKAANAKK